MPGSVSLGRQVAITNLAKRSLVISLNSKESVHLGPGARSAAIAEYEVSKNPDIEKLRKRGLIDVAAVPNESQPERSEKPAKSQSREK
jgi:hypothetical protein